MMTAGNIKYTVDDENKIVRVTNYEKHGKLTDQPWNM